MDDTTTIAPAGNASSFQDEIGLHEFVHDLGVNADPLLQGRLSVLLPTPGAIVRADRRQLAEALVSLLSSAALHGHGPVELRVLREREAWRFEVQDEGGELAPAADDADFDLHRAQPEQVVRVLALELLQAVAEAHGGSAGVDGIPAAGATYWLRLPKQL